MEPIFVDQGLDLGQFRDLVNQGSRVITDQGVAATTAIRHPLATMDLVEIRI
jgi:hypothetical protein